LYVHKKIYREKPTSYDGWGGFDTHQAFAMVIGVDFELLVTSDNGKNI
jgi:hypothetical protein